MNDAAAPLGSFLDSQSLRNALLGPAQALSVLKIVEHGFEFGFNRSQVIEPIECYKAPYILMAKMYSNAQCKLTGSIGRPSGI